MMECLLLRTHYVILLILHGLQVVIGGKYSSFYLLGYAIVWSPPFSTLKNEAVFASETLQSTYDATLTQKVII
jgi:hypothetical protein